MASIANRSMTEGGCSAKCLRQAKELHLDVSAFNQIIKSCVHLEDGFLNMGPEVTMFFSILTCSEMI
jgi:hypothetical protein